MRNIYGLGDVNLQIENFTWSALVKSYLKGSHIFKTLLCLWERLVDGQAHKPKTIEAS